ncbi:MAG: Smr/MutS family protein [Caulobacterales bacterium]
MRRRPRHLTSEETTLWKRVTSSVRPLNPRPEQPAAAPEVAEGPAVVLAKPAKTKSVSSLPSVSPPVSVPARPPSLANRSGERRVQRGQVRLAGTIDLHGFTQDQARAALIGFLSARQGSEASVVLVVTGKGGRLIHGEAAPGVLKQRLPGWLADPALRDIVSGFSSAHRRHGGGGAYYVFLRRRAD